jgi:hypothetical protein
MVTGLFKDMATRWPSTWVARTEVENFTGGLISEKYLANLDSAGKGPLRAESGLSGLAVCFLAGRSLKRHS